MDFSSLFETPVAKEAVENISRQSGASDGEVKSVLSSALPLFLNNGTQSNTSALSGLLGGGSTSTGGLISTLLGGNAQQTISQQSGVSNDTTGSILNLAAPMVANALVSNNNTGSDMNILSLLTGLAGAGTSNTAAGTSSSASAAPSLLSLLAPMLMGLGSAGESAEAAADDGLQIVQEEAPAVQPQVTIDPQAQEEDKKTGLFGFLSSLFGRK
ncbi:MAG: DUF937 domain-containing protein [Lachnospiraceae bacterium]|nr:DUF937 domain-containing protein [Lachnospiraceae bacterium]